MRIGSYELKLFKSPVQKDVELGHSGTTIFNGFITDEDYVSELKGEAAITTYDKMRKSDGVIKAALLACELPIRASNWYIEPVSEEKKDVEVADFVSACLFEKMSITWDDFLRQALLCLPFGFAVFEKVFGVVEIEGKQMIGWKKFAPRAQNTILKWQTVTGDDGVTQLTPDGREVSIPIEKLLIFTHQKEGDNWVGISVLRNAYRSWYFKSHIEKINAIAFERQGLGIPIGRLPRGYTKKDRDTMEDLLKNVRANEQSYMIIPEGWGVEFADTKGNSAKDPTPSIQRYNREMLISVLAQFLDLGSGPNGSRALSADHSTTFHNNLTAVARGVKDIINKYAIKQLVDLNYTVEKYPTLEFSKLGRIEYDTVSRAISSLVQQGVIVPDRKLEDYLRQLIDLPEKEEEEKEKKIQPKSQPKPEPEEAREIMASEFSSWRPLTFAEKKVNFSDIKRKMDKTENDLRLLLKSIMSQVSNDLIRQMQIVLEKPDSTERRERLKTMAVKYQGEYRKVIYNVVKEMNEYGKTIASHEIKKTPPPSPASSIRDISKQADTLVEIMANDMMKAGKLSLLLSLQQKDPAGQTLAKITRSIKKESDNILRNVPALTVGGAINQGRRIAQAFFKEDIYALQRSEILDNVTCSFCISIDKRIFRKNDPFTRVDLIHSSCRGIWVSIMKEETDKPPIEGMPQSLRDSFETVNVFKPPKNPIIKKDSPASDFLKEKVEKLSEIEDIQTAKENVADDIKKITKIRELIKKVL